MADPVSDVLQHIRQLLLADSTVNGLIGNNGAIYTADPRTDPGAIPMPCLIFEVTYGRPGASAIPYQQLVIQAFAFSRQSQEEAYALYDAARLVLNMARLHSEVASNGVRVNKTSGYIEENERPQGSWHEAYSAWSAAGRYIAYTATAST